MSGIGLPLLSRTSEVRYAAAGDAHAAHRVITGTGGDEHDVVLSLSGTMSMEALFDDPVCLRLIDGLTDVGRLHGCGIRYHCRRVDLAATARRRSAEETDPARARLYDRIAAVLEP